MKKTRIEIINEVVEFYTADPKSRRSIINRACLYNGSNGSHCAIGKYLKPELQAQGDKLKGNSEALSDLQDSQNVERLDDLLIEEVRGYEKHFWGDLQSFHDSDPNWDLEKNCLTEHGKERVKQLLARYANR